MRILLMFERLFQGLRNHKKEIENLILQDQVRDFAEYRYLTGKVKGLEDAIDICTEIFKGQNNE